MSLKVDNRDTKPAPKNRGAIAAASLGVAACAACCAPLLLSLLAGASGAGIAGATATGMFGASWGEIACAAIIAALAASALVLGLRALAQRKQVVSGCACGSSNRGTCSASTSCKSDP